MDTQAGSTDDYMKKIKKLTTCVFWKLRFAIEFEMRERDRGVVLRERAKKGEREGARRWANLVRSSNEILHLREPAQGKGRSRT